MTSAPLSISYYFHPDDLAFCETLERYLAPLKQKNRIRTWYERRVLAGNEWQRERDQHLSTDHLLILLISPAFLASENVEQQIRLALHRHQNGSTVVIPILVRPCLWQETALKSLQILPRAQGALSLHLRPEELWQEVVEDLIHVMNSIQLLVLVYAPEDRYIAGRISRDIVEHIHRDMDASRVLLWSLEWNLSSPDSHLHTEARNAIRSASTVVLIATPDAISSHAVQVQMNLVDDYQRPIVVIWARGEKWDHSHPGKWHVEEVIDARAERYEEGRATLLARLKQKKRFEPSSPLSFQFSSEPRNPYKGLQPFTANDRRDFFGRKALTEELATMLEKILVQDRRRNQHARLLAVVGASGSGKSSVVMAGLLPCLQEEGVFDSQEWTYLNPTVPGTDPLDALAVSLAQHPSSKRDAIAIREVFRSDSLRSLHILASELAGPSQQQVVLVIDQFEEVFTLTTSEEVRKRFFDLLTTAVTEPHGPLLVILTMRADFYDRPMQYPALYHLLESHRVSVLPMEHKDLRQVIEQPALLDDVRIRFEGDLVGDILFDMNEQVGTLPLLQFTLDQLFARRSGRELTLQAYHEIGGVKGALAKHAEANYADLSTDTHRTLARVLFLRLIDPGLNAQDTTRRRATRSEFVLPSHTQTRMLDETIDAFISARLLTANEMAGISTLEVSHETLIREWPRLASWLDEAREDIRVQHKLSEDVAEWEQRNKPKDRLYRGSQLKETQRWAKRNVPSQKEVAFLNTSARQAMYSVALVIAIGLVLLSSVGVAAFFYFKQPPDSTRVTSSQDDGVGSLRWAINNAPSNSTLTFDQGLWGHTILLSADLNMTNKKLSIHGPGRDKLTISNGSHRIHIAPGASISIFGLTFTGSKTSPDSLLNNEGTLTLTDCAISDNSIRAGLEVPAGSGGITNWGTLTLTNSIVSGNTGFTINSGGITNTGTGTLTITNSFVFNNTTQGSGGGISNMGMLTVTNSTISGNTASGIDALGFSNGPLTRPLALNNSAQSGLAGNEGGIAGSGQVEGGGGVANSGKFILINSTISGNTLTGPEGYGGGGIASLGGTLTLINSTISHNTVLDPNDNGGGILSAWGKVEIAFCTIYGNSAASMNGDEISLPGTNPGSFVMRNSLVAGNHASADSDISAKGNASIQSEGYNLIQNASGVTMQSTDISGDPNIDPNLGWNGGPTQTLALRSNSPAINKIPLSACHITFSSFAITTDQRGIRRPQGAACDIGAYEYAP